MTGRKGTRARMNSMAARFDLPDSNITQADWTLVSGPRDSTDDFVATPGRYGGRCIKNLIRTEGLQRFLDQHPMTYHRGTSRA